MLIKNAKIYTMDRPGIIENGFIAVKNGKIIEVGDMKLCPKNDDEVIDADKMCAVPGYIDAHSHIGMWEDGLGFEGDDGNEETDPITPQLRAIDAINPMDRAFKEALSAGITTVVTGPGSANPIGGQLLSMKTYGHCTDKMVLKAPLAVKMAFGENPKTIYNDKNQSPITRMAVASEIREALFKAQEYLARLEDFKDENRDDPPDFDMKSEALIPLLKREIQLHAHAHRADDIFTAIRIAEEFNLDLVLVHATEGYLIADDIKEKNIPVLIGPIISDRSKPELRNQSDGAAATLANSGVSLAIICDHPVTPQKFLAFSAKIAIENGLDDYEALKAITCNPADICSLSDRVGRIKKGMDADILLGKEPLMTKPKTVIAGGKVC